MSDLVEIWEQPAAAKFMIAGWQQWADAGDVSSGLPEYLIEHTDARHIGQLAPNGYYLFQIPTGHHLMRPIVKLNDGHVEGMDEKGNDLYYAGDDERGFVIFTGDEPQMNHETYADAFLDSVEALGIERIILVGGVYGAVPFDKDREVSCAYSLPSLKAELEDYAVRFSNYEGGSTIGTYIVYAAEQRGIEAVGFNAMVPSYDFTHEGLSVQPVVISEDYKAWYDLMLRLNHMGNLDIDLSELAAESQELISSWDEKIQQLADSMPELQVEQYLDRVRAEFRERPFVPLGDVWIQGLKGLFDEGTEGAEDDEP
ncbi:MAG: PAC2 family protein [Chloroflexi bacterium]|nr:PAC2 family protein [Chloroflexota bacterium]